MRNILVKIAYAIGIFIATVLVTEAITGSHGTATTEALSKATLPVVTVLRDDDTAFNEMHGYTSERDPGAFRASITPVNADREISLSIDPYGQQVTSLSYELRDLTGDRLIDSQSVSGFYVLDGGVTRVSFQLGNLMSDNTEYLLVLRMSTTNVEEVLFYTRVVYAAETVYGNAGELQYNRVLDFVESLHDRTFEKDNRSAIATYLYLDSTSGTSSYGDVVNGSSYEEVTWGDLSPDKVSDPVWTITEIQQNVYGVEAFYVVEIADTENDERTTRCDVQEYYRLYEGSDRFHVLDYERITDTINDASDGNYSNDTIDLGITGSGVTAMTSDNAEYTAYVHDGRLYLCGIYDGTLSYVFGFAEADSLDRRDLWRDSEIKILRVDDDGNVDFLVYGYMNRGGHEGDVGAAAYRYSNAQRTIEERAYVPYSGSAEVLQAQIENASYLAENGRLYLLLGENLIRIDTANSTADVQQTNMQECDVAVSDSGEYIAWRAEDGSIVLMDLEDLSQRTIAIASGEIGIPLGFMGEDLIYGIAREADLADTEADEQLRPMYTVQIVNSILETLENYTPGGYYVSDAVIGEGQITLRRMEQRTDANGRIYYVRAEDDQILSGTSQDAGSVGVTSGTDSFYGRVTSIAVKGFSADNVRYYRPNEILYEGARAIVLASTDADTGSLARYEVYNYQGLAGLTYNAREAINAAEDAAGVVVDETGRYLWQSQFRSVAEIEEISGRTGVAIADDTVAACVAEITEYEGNPQTAASIASTASATTRQEEDTADAAPRMSMLDAVTAIETYVDGVTAVDVSGVSLDRVLYYVSIYKPVLAMTSGSTAVLIVGYSDSNIILYDPAAGGRVVTTRGNAQSMFLAGGSRYVVYY